MRTKARSFNIVVCGTGATGSQLIPFLTQLVCKKTNCSITLVDGDVVELKNTRNQKFLESDDGMSKAAVLQRRFANVYPELDISYVDRYIQGKEDISKLMCKDKTTLNILIGCVDNNPTRKIMKEVFHDEDICNIVYIDSGNGTDDMIGQIVTGYKRRTGYKQVPDANGSYQIFTTKSVTEIVSPCAGDLFEDIDQDTDTVDHVTSCSYVADKNPQNIATNIMAASTIFSIVNQILSFQVINTGITYFDATNQSIVYRPLIVEGVEEEAV